MSGDINRVIDDRLTHIHAVVVPLARKRNEAERAPVLALWAAIVAERLGYPTPAALTLDRAVAG